MLNPTSCPAVRVVAWRQRGRGSGREAEDGALRHGWWPAGSEAGGEATGSGVGVVGEWQDGHMSGQGG